ncbi:PAS domain-containing sensor histidine kinase [Roseofilum casamattae]|uniref:histidine kinase n=1 Tax=Roseofilum casamattae BLCC-M143 TaxID=3022442 RepID=A0ABT7BZJ8_9CYAN|nr:ATP-binding protein [Roseofilum casamattae]MDJ1184631.1 ATP-binding protein [Roseofilum casamattae BLCC-M143]
MYLHPTHSTTDGNVTPMSSYQSCQSSSHYLRQSLVKRTQQLAKANLQLASEVNKRKHVEIAFDRIEKQYCLMFENAVEGRFQISPEGWLILANTAFAQIYGYQSLRDLEQAAKNMGDYYLNRQQYSQWKEAMAEQGTIRGFEYQICRPDGERIWIVQTAREVRDDEGNLLYYEGIVEEISDRKQGELNLQTSAAYYQRKVRDLQHALEEAQSTAEQMQRQLIQQEKMSSLGELVAGVAHEINNPVSFVCGNLNHAIAYTDDLLRMLELYQTHYPEAVAEIEEAAEDMDIEFLLEDFPQVLKSMAVGTNRIGQLVASLRHFSRRDRQERQLVDLHAGLESTLMILHNRLQARGDHPEIKIHRDYGDLPQILGYAGEINQVFMNLLSNAIDALEECFDCSSSEFGQITIATRYHSAEGHSPETISICIADNGTGMSAEVRSRLFETFFTTKPIGKGTGLGLSISRQIIVDKHGGDLRCESTPGAGTVFTIELPVGSD